MFSKLLLMSLVGWFVSGNGCTVQTPLCCANTAAVGAPNCSFGETCALVFPTLEDRESWLLTWRDLRFLFDE